MKISLTTEDVICNEDKKIATIYSIENLFYYIIKISYRNKFYYLETDGFTNKFENLIAAKKACKNHFVDEVYLAVDRTYYESHPYTETLMSSVTRYNYHKLKL